MYDDTIIKRHAAVLYPVVQQEVAESTRAMAGSIRDTADILLPVLLKSKEQEGMLGVAIYDPEGSIIQHTNTLLVPELIFEVTSPCCSAASKSAATDQISR